VLLLGRPSIFTDAIQKILENSECIELVGVTPFEAGKIEMINRFHPDVVVLAGEGGDPPVIEICLARLLRTYPDLPVIVTSAAEDILYIYTSRRGVAQSPDLIAAIAASPKRGQMDAID
jgi:chemotaxis response regulator CheB